MSHLLIKNGTVYDPKNNVDGEVRDIWVQDGRVVEAPADPSVKPLKTLDAAGYVIMPGGVDMHCHIAGPKVNTARKMMPVITADDDAAGNYASALDIGKRRFSAGLVVLSCCRRILTNGLVG